MHWNELDVWKKAHELVLEIYKVTVNFPREEIYGLTSQLKRAAMSVPSNIVEGNARRTTKDYIHFLYTSRGSLEEVRYDILLAQELQFLSVRAYHHLEQLAETVSKLLNGLVSSLERKIK